MEGIGITCSRGGKLSDLCFARSNMVGNPQRRHNVDTPGCAEIA
jgi:hypothetical protein